MGSIGETVVFSAGDQDLNMTRAGVEDKSAERTESAPTVTSTHSSRHLLGWGVANFNHGVIVGCSVPGIGLF